MFTSDTVILKVEKEFIQTCQFGKRKMTFISPTAKSTT